MKPLARTLSLCALSLASALGGVCIERQALSNLRSENHRLRGKSEEIGRLSRENAEINALRAEVHEIDQLREETRDLHKLRNDVRQLRELKPEWDKLRAENQKLRAGAESGRRLAALPADSASLITNEMLSDAGLGSPEAALRTFFWAIREGDAEKIRSCFTPDTPSERIPAGDGAPQPTFKELRVVAKKVASADDILLGIQFSTEGGRAPEELVLPFKRVNGEWKLNIAGAQK